MYMWMYMFTHIRLYICKYTRNANEQKTALSVFSSSGLGPAAGAFFAQNASNNASKFCPAFLHNFWFVFGSILGAKMLQKCSPKRPEEKTGAKNTKTRNRTTSQWKCLFFRSHLVPKRSQNEAKCVPRGLRKRCPKNDPKMMPKMPPKCLPKWPKMTKIRSNLLTWATMGPRGSRRGPKRAKNDPN